MLWEPQTNHNEANPLDFEMRENTGDGDRNHLLIIAWISKIIQYREKDPLTVPASICENGILCLSV